MSDIVPNSAWPRAKVSQIHIILPLHNIFDALAQSVSKTVLLAVRLMQRKLTQKMYPTCDLHFSNSVHEQDDGLRPEKDEVWEVEIMHT
jgi:hypothetical protein